MEQEPKWKYTASIYMKKRHVLVFRDNALRLQLQVISRIPTGGGPPRKLYFVDGESTAYSTERDLLRALTLPPGTRTMGIHPLYIEYMPAQLARDRTPRESVPRLPTLLEESTRWGTAFARKVMAMMHALASGLRSPLHRLSR